MWPHQEIHTENCWIFSLSQMLLGVKLDSFNETLGQKSVRTKERPHQISLNLLRYIKYRIERWQSYDVQ